MMAQPGERLRRRPEAHRPRERTVLPERRAAQHDYVGFDFDQVVVSEIVLRHVADGEIFGDEIALPDNLARDFLRLGHRKIQRETAARGIDRVEDSAAIGADRSVGAGQKPHQVGRARRFDSDHVGSQSAQPRGRVRDREDPAEVGDANSFQRPRLLFQVIPAGDAVAAGDGHDSEVFFRCARRGAARRARFATACARTCTARRASALRAPRDDRGRRKICAPCIARCPRLRPANAPGSTARAPPAPSRMPQFA